MTTKNQTGRAGFTLAEILLAMLVFAIAISTILALLARSVETADEILLKNEAIDLSSALNAFLTEQPFEDAYDLVADPSQGVVFGYKYRGDLDPTTYQDDGSLAPYTVDEDSDLGTDYTVTPVIRDPAVTTTAELNAEDAVREGRLFRIELSVSPANPYGTTIPPTPNDTGDFYDSAVLVIFAEFYSVPVFGFEPPNTVEPVFSFNLAVRR